MMNSDIREWLIKNKEWIIVTELKDHLEKKGDVDSILKSHSLGYLTQNGVFCKRLIELPNFIKIKQVVKAHYLLDQTLYQSMERGHDE